MPDYIDDEKIIDGEEADSFGPDLQDEGDDDEPVSESRRRHYVAIFAVLLANTTDRVETLIAHLVDGTLDIDAWATHFADELAAAHSEAAMLGRKMAGDAKALSRADIDAGDGAWAVQMEYFVPFVEEYKGGRYRNDQGDLKLAGFAARAKSYVPAIRGTLRESFRTTMGSDSLRWVLGQRDHCQRTDGFEYDCPTLSNEPPRHADEWPTSPGLGDTPCLNHCDCHWESQDGDYSTRGI